MIREMTESDIPVAVNLYSRLMFDSLFAELGPAFLTRLFRGLIASRHGFNHVWERESRVIGFISATTDTKAVFREILTRFAPGIALTALGMTIRRPGTLRHLAETFLYSRKTGVEDVKPELLFISVEPVHRNRGIARKMISHTLEIFRTRGCSRVKVTTVKGNDSVNHLLEDMGFRPVREFRFYGKDNLLYETTL